MAGVASFRLAGGVEVCRVAVASPKHKITETRNEDGRAVAMRIHDCGRYLPPTPDASEHNYLLESSISPGFRMPSLTPILNQNSPLASPPLETTNLKQVIRTRRVVNRLTPDERLQDIWFFPQECANSLSRILKIVDLMRSCCAETRNPKPNCEKCAEVIRISFLVRDSLSTIFLVACEVRPVYMALSACE
jgi:hypothetical protein